MAAGRASVFSVAEARALLELGVSHHGRYLTESEYAGILAVIDKLRGDLNRSRATRESFEGLPEGTLPRV